MTIARRGLLLACAALLAVALPAAPSAHAAAYSETSKLVSSQLPAGVTLAKASIDQTAAAVKIATAQRPDLASTIVQVAILAKTPKQGRGKLSCEDVLKIANAAIASAPDKRKEVVDMAKSLNPECTDSLDTLLGASDRNFQNELVNPADEYSFGLGLGPGFPGSPSGFGSAPSGAVALPPLATPSVPPVTNSANL